MKILVERLFSDKENGTTGVMFVDGEFAGYTLEDEFRVEKVRNETRIPAGFYRIKLRDEGGMNARYREKYGDRHRGMLWLQDVPNFEWIYIHPGNTTDHTSGCILVGYGALWTPGTRPRVMASTDCYHAIARGVHGALDRGEQVSIEIVDRDR